VITVADDGRGLGSSSAGGSGIGLSNVRARLAALFGRDASLVVAAAPGRGVIATLSLPFETGAR
jgi:signal transduction histidine kinase